MLDSKRRLDETLTIKYLASQKPGFFTTRRIAAATTTARKAVRTAHDAVWKREFLGTTSPLLDQVLTTHFKGASDPFYLSIIRTILLLTERGIGSDLNISDIAGRDGSEGSVKFKYGYVKGDPTAQGSIHLAFDLTSTYSETAIARIIVHEATHKFADTEDHAYSHETAKWSAMTMAQACDNADSYAYAAISLLRGRLVDWQTMRDAGKH
jgi:hypothetical protein